VVCFQREMFFEGVGRVDGGGVFGAQSGGGRIMIPAHCMGQRQVTEDDQCRLTMLLAADSSYTSGALALTGERWLAGVRVLRLRR